MLAESPSPETPMPFEVVICKQCAGCNGRHSSVQAVETNERFMKYVGDFDEQPMPLNFTIFWHDVHSYAAVMI